MVKVKLNENYMNEFLTTTNGCIFYRKDNKLKKTENIIDVDLNNIEIANLLSQGVLKLAIDEKNEFHKITIKEDTPKAVMKEELVVSDEE